MAFFPRSVRKRREFKKISCIDVSHFSPPFVFLSLSLSPPQNPGVIRLLSLRSYSLCLTKSLSSPPWPCSLSLSVWSHLARIHITVIFFNYTRVRVSRVPGLVLRVSGFHEKETETFPSKPDETETKEAGAHHR